MEVPSWRRWQDRVRTLERETFPWIEFGEKIHYRENIKASAKQNKLDFRQEEVTTWVVGGAQAKLLSGHALAFYVLVLYASLEFIAGGT